MTGTKRSGYTFGLIFLASLMAAAMASAAVTLGTAGSYGVLSSTFTANGGNTAVAGDAGYTTLSGSGTHTVSGADFQPAPAQAGLDQASALAALNGLACSSTYATGDIDLASDLTFGPAGVFTPGVYCIDGVMNIAGGLTMTLSGKGLYVFRSTGAFNASANSQVVLTGGAQASDVFWVPAAATTLGANSVLVGTIIDDAGITGGSTSVLTGRALAFNGTVTLDTDVVTVPVPGALASISLSKTTVGMNASVNVMLTVTNTGGVALANVVGQVTVAGPASYTAPSPVLVSSLAAGASVTFTWTASPTGGGTILFTAFADGETGSGTLETAHKSGSVVVPGPALDARLNAAKTTVSVGQGVQLILTVTNTGGTAASNIKAVAWSLTINGTNPQPATVASLAAGAKTTLIWTVTPTAGQVGASIIFTASASGDFLAPTAMTSATITVQTAPVMTAKMVTTSATVTGGPFLVMLTVSNSGQAGATVLGSTSMFVVSTGASATPYLTGPTPASGAAVASGATITLTWTVNGGNKVASGTTLKNTFSFTDANGGPAPAAQTVTSAAMKLIGLTGLLSVTRTTVNVGDPVTFVLSVTNTGGATATNLTASLWTYGAAGIAIGAVTPASVASLAPGALTTFSWTVVPADARTDVFFANATGTIAGLAGPVVVVSPDASARLPGIPLPDAGVTFLFPSPARDAASIGYTMAESGTVTIRVYNAGGRLVDTVEDAKPAGAQTTVVTTAKLSPGVYFYLLERKYGSGTSDKIGPHKFAVAR